MHILLQDALSPTPPVRAATRTFFSHPCSAVHGIASVALFLGAIGFVPPAAAAVATYYGADDRKTLAQAVIRIDRHRPHVGNVLSVRCTNAATSSPMSSRCRCALFGAIASSVDDVRFHVTPARNHCAGLIRGSSVRGSPFLTLETWRSCIFCRGCRRRTPSLLRPKGNSTDL